MVKQFREAAVEVPIVGIEFTQDAQTIAGDLYDTYVFATDYYDAKNPNPWNVEFVEGHQEKYGEDQYYGANYYEQVFVIWDLMRRVWPRGAIRSPARRCSRRSSRIRSSNRSMAATPKRSAR